MPREKAVPHRVEKDATPPAEDADDDLMSSDEVGDLPIAGEQPATVAPAAETPKEVEHPESAHGGKSRVRVTVHAPKVPIIHHGGKKAPVKVHTATSDAPTKRKHRFHPGTVAMRQIRHLQKTTDLLLRKFPFQRLVREIAQSYTDDSLRFKKSALLCLQEATETYLIEMLSKSNRIAVHARRVTVNPHDMELAREISGETMEKTD